MGIFLKSATYSDSVEEQREAFLGKVLPLAEGVHHGPGGSERQLAFVEELGGQRQQGLVRAVVVEQLRHLQHTTTNRLDTRANPHSFVSQCLRYAHK